MLYFFFLQKNLSPVDAHIESDKEPVDVFDMTKERRGKRIEGFYKLSVQVEGRDGETVQLILYQTPEYSKHASL